MVGTWAVIFHPEVVQWLVNAEAEVQERILAAIDILKMEGPQLGRPTSTRSRRAGTRT